MNGFAMDFKKLQDIVNSTGGGNFPDRPYGFFSVDDGGTQTVRFASGMEEMVLFSHKCGLNEYEIPVRVFEEQKQGGVPMSCPQCREVLTEADMVAKRPAVIMRTVHSYVPSANGKNSRFVCLNTVPSNLDANGQPKTPCPICAIKKTNDKNELVSKYPTREVYYGFALQRTKRTGQAMVNGVFAPTVEAIETVMNDDKPSLVLIEKGSAFWKPVFASYISNNYTVAFWDYDVARTGQKLNTTYSLQRVPGDPSIVPFASYGDLLAESVEHLNDWLDYLGSEKHYQKSGWGVDGAISDAAAAATQQAAPAGTVSFDQFSSRVASGNPSMSDYM